ncbi:uncharacterized protein LOC129805464 [Phlebotomus papatasi]|uniref:uncharacterized protein LOC129805464 n=1 Tax=Phlebotomus papatasi TaxID=29031 RepID=UPI0024834A34|nr:uncharacterized protein LOC129805464 [Phlebotomus papatasi]
MPKNKKIKNKRVISVQNRYQKSKYQRSEEIDKQRFHQCEEKSTMSDREMDEDGILVPDDDMRQGRNQQIKMADDITISSAQLEDIIGVSSPSQQMTPNDPKSKTESPLKYQLNDKGPFFIIMKHEELRYTEIAKIVLISVGRPKIDQIIKLDDHSVKVKLKDADSANKILKSQSLARLQNVNVSIPPMYLNSIGIIDNVAITHTTEEILEALDSDNQITKIERMTKWDPVYKKATPMEQIKIHFRCFTLPRTVKLFMINFRVRFFFPRPTYCVKCLSYGHYKKICRQKPKCAICTKETEGQHECEQFCKFCETTDHQTNDRTCKERIRQAELTKIMIKEKMTYKEAVQALKEGEKNTTAFPRLLRIDLSEEYAKLKELSQKTADLQTQLDNMKLQNDKVKQVLREICTLATAEESQKNHTLMMRRLLTILEENQDILD